MFSFFFGFFLFGNPFFFKLVKKLAQILSLRSQLIHVLFGLFAFNFNDIADFGLFLNQRFHPLMFFFQNLFLFADLINLGFHQIFSFLDGFKLLADFFGIFFQMRYRFPQQHGAADNFYRRQRLHKQCFRRLKRQILQSGQGLNQILVFAGKSFFGFLQIFFKQFQLLFHFGKFFFVVLNLPGCFDHFLADHRQLHIDLVGLRLQFAVLDVLELDFFFDPGQLLFRNSLCRHRSALKGPSQNAPQKKNGAGRGQFHFSP